MDPCPQLLCLLLSFTQIPHVFDFERAEPLLHERHVVDDRCSCPIFGDATSRPCRLRPLTHCPPVSCSAFRVTYFCIEKIPADKQKKTFCGRPVDDVAQKPELTAHGLFSSPLSSIDGNCPILTRMSAVRRTARRDVAVVGMLRGVTALLMHRDSTSNDRNGT